MVDPKNDNYVIEDRSQLIYALTEAAQLEHVLMCQYLFAGASLKTHVSELASGPRRYQQIELIRYWKRKLFEIAREEMQHLAMAMNLLVAVGGQPTFERPNFPNVNYYYKQETPDGLRGLEMTLERFSGPPDERLRTIDRFVRFEQPHPRAPEFMLLMAIPKPNVYDSVGVLYLAIRDALGRLPNIIIDKDDQYDPSDEYAQPIRTPNRPNLSTAIKTVADAQALVDEIVREGEGFPDVQHDPSAHFTIFSRIREEFASELAADPAFEPARNVVPNPATRMHEGAGKATIIEKAVDEGFQFNLLQLFAGAYEVLLGWLGQLFSGGGGTKPPALRAIETITFLPYMSEVIAPLAELLTLAPVARGSDQRLGPTFEVTSNDFLIPPLPIAMTLSFERLRDLSAMADRLTVQATGCALTDIAERLGFVAKTLHLLSDELDSRTQHGWPPSSGAWDATYSEQAADTFKYDFSKHAVLELRFEGVAQCRLATDPDGADVRRGVTGNGFAIGDEPDLDRIIRFQPEKATLRSHCPRVGVVVKAASLKQRDLAPWADSGQPVSSLEGASVDLAGDPKFEGRNHLVSEDGEPIDPFEIRVTTADGDVFARRARGIPINDMTPLQRRGAGRYPVSVSRSEEAMLENLAVIGRQEGGERFETPLAFTLARIEQLKRSRETLDDQVDTTGVRRAELDFRLRSLDEGLRRRNEPDARPIRWTRYFFDAQYKHLISGDASVNLREPLREQIEF